MRRFRAAPPLTVSALTTVLVLAACTGSSDKSPATTSPSGSGATSGTSAGSSAAPVSAERVTRFTQAWSWQVLPATSDLTPDTVDAAVMTRDRIVLAEVARTNPLGFVGSRTQIVTADLATRKQVWKHEINGEADSVRVIANTVVVNVTTDVDKPAILIGLDLATGAQRWSKVIAPGIGALGTSVIAATKTNGVAQTRRFDADTGEDIAVRSGYVAGVVGTADDLVVFGNGSNLTALSADLQDTAWTHDGDSGTSTDDYIVGDTVVTVPNSDRKIQVTGYDVHSGAQRWVRPLTLDGDLAHTSVTGDQILLQTATSMTAISSDTGAVDWQVDQSGAMYMSAVSPANLIACGRSVLSVSSDDGGLYGFADLPADAFANTGCQMAPLVTGSGSVLPDSTLVVGPNTIVAYRLVTSDDAPTKADGFGRWGPPAADACRAPDTTRTFAALNKGVQPRWQVVDAKSAYCVWRPDDAFPIAQTGNLASADAARRYLEPANKAGGCQVPNWTGGTEAVLSVTGKGLPAGSGACSLLGNTKGGEHETDIFTGVSRLPDGRWFYLELYYPYLKGKDFEGDVHLIRTLQALAG